MSTRPFDLICLGRAAVDLYGEQLGSPLEDMQSFAKYVGGCAANIAVGTARLGLKTAMLTRVGDEHMGRFVRQTLAQEGVDVSHVVTDPTRLTGLVLLGIRDCETFPLIFYRENCADMAVDTVDFDADFIGSARALLVVGTHFSTPQVDRVSRAAVGMAKERGTKVVLDIDYRPVLWGLTGHGAGEERFVASDSVSAHLQSIVGSCDLVVGTEEEIHIAGGSTDTGAALRCLREHTTAVVVMKRGKHGCVIYDGAIPERWQDGLSVPGFAVDALNVLGAGDAFLSGFLKGWLHKEPLVACGRYANACGALVVSRHGCSPAMPTAPELLAYLERAAKTRQPDSDNELFELHRVTTPRPAWPELCVLAIDNRLYLEKLARELGAPEQRLYRLKALLAEGGRRLLAIPGLPPLGVLLDEKWGAAPLAALTQSGLWLGRPIEISGQTPLAFLDNREAGIILRSWPQEHVIKVLVRYHPDDRALSSAQLPQLLRLFWAAAATHHELLIELVPPDGAALESTTLSRAIEQIYAVGVRPEWWKLPAPAEAESWRHIEESIRANDSSCRGVLALGGGLDEAELTQRFRVAGQAPICRGFAVGRTIFAEPSRAWLAGELDDEATVARVRDGFLRVVALWQQRRQV